MELLFLRAKEHKKISFIALWILIVAAFVGFYVVFNTHFLNFWWNLSSVIVVLALLGILSRGDIAWKVNRYEAATFIWVSFATYFLFWILNFIASFSTLFRNDIKNVYTLGNGLSRWEIAIFIVVIAIAEELFWRGFVTKAFLERTGIIVSLFVPALIYGAVHIATGNIALMLSAFILGLIWGAMYILTGNVAVSMYSHIIWDLLIFIVFPLK